MGVGSEGSVVFGVDVVNIGVSVVNVGVGVGVGIECWCGVWWE